MDESNSRSERDEACIRAMKDKLAEVNKRRRELYRMRAQGNPVGRYASFNMASGHQIKGEIIHAPETGRGGCWVVLDVFDEVVYIQTFEHMTFYSDGS